MFHKSLLAQQGEKECAKLHSVVNKLVVVAALSTGLLVCLTLFMKPDLSEQFLQPHFSVNLPGVPPLPRSQPHLDWASQLHCNVIGNPKWAGRAVQPQRTREAHYFEEADYHYMDKPGLGDLVHVRVDVYDGRGRPLSRGGDEVRVLLQEPEKKASLATEVTDLGNGSYYAAVPLLWTGSPLVKASLVYNRELIRAHHYARSAVKSIKNIAAGFKSFFASEATLCSPFPFLPGYSRFCNFTEENGGMPWYCGHPRNEALTCRHWWRSFDLEFVYPLPVTAAEEAWSTYVASRKPTARVPTEIKVKVTDSAKPSPQRHTTSPPVGKAANLQSWTSQAPRGYFLQNSWVSSSSTIPKFTKPQLLQCLKNTTVLFLGDSNARLAFKILAERVGCSLNTGEVKPSWHHPLSCEDNQNNIYMYWQIHALPFHAGKKSGCDRGDSKSAKQYIDEIPAEGKYLLMIHLNLHFPAHHYSVFTSQMHQVRASVERVLRRNPEVKVVVRGPHQALKGWVPLNGGDITAHVLTNIIKRLFEGLTDRVFFLQPWDMTVAIQNGPFHPSNLVNNAISDLFLAYACYSSEGGRKLL
ncbi:NXPE family member 3 [Aplysia californica]|uniref:NXPE family member 3 n=1 Tax=Aplysia californica TaxID=6500 RepID=A0ABM1W3J4_APLCA|nr:NXPE family member 3 [Aplysia californica]